VPPTVQFNPDACEFDPSSSFWANVELREDPLEAAPLGGPARQWQALSFCTANVLTLHPAQEAVAGISVRRLQLEQEFDTQGLAFVGIQEGRRREPASQRGRSFWMVAAGAEPSGTCGVELWVHQSQVQSDRDLALVYQDPRRLLVSVRTKAGRFNVAVLHAPCTSSPVEERLLWWQGTAQKLDLFSSGVPTVWLADTNLRFGSVSSSAVGAVEPETECDVAAAVHGLLVQRQLFLPSTFLGGGPTWVHASGVRHRLDFVVLPAAWQPAVLQAWTLPEACLAIADREDHRAAAVRVAVPAGERQPGGEPCQRPWYSRRALKLPDVQAAIASAWAATPPLPDGLSAESLLGLFTRYCRQLLVQFCPIERRAPFRDWVTPDTWSLIQQHADLRRRFFDLCRLRSRARAGAVFYAWKAAMPWCKVVQLWSATLGPIPSQWRQAKRSMDIAVVQQWLQPAARAAAAANLRDLKAWLRQRAQGIGAAAEGGNLAPMWGLVQQLSGRRRKQGLRVLAVLKRRDGSVATSALQASQAWGDLFMEDFGFGAIDTNEAALREHVAAVRSRLPSPPEPPARDAFVSKVGDAVRACRSGKAVGSDQVPMELLSLGGPPVHQFLADIYLAGGRDGVPMSFRGSRMAPVPRKPGRPLSLDNGRGVACDSAISKPLGRLLRAELRGAMVAEVSELQSGAVPGGSTEVPAHIGILFLQGARRSHHSAAALFVDIRAAFYTSWPELVVGPLLLDEQRSRLFQASGIPLEQQAFLTEAILHGHRVLDKRGVEAFWSWLAVDWHTGNHFTVGVDPTIHQTLLGARPGNSLADLIFVLFFVVIQRSLLKALVAEELVVFEPFLADGLFGQHRGPAMVPLAPPTFMDDFVVLLRHADPRQLVAMLRRAAQIVCTITANHGLQVNFKAGKTEALVVLAGPGHAAVRDELWHHTEDIDGDGPVPVLALEGGQRLRIVSRYKHLGMLASSSRSFEPELSARVKAANTATIALAGKLFGSPFLDDSIKTQLAAACIASRALSGCGLWPPLLPQQLRRLEAAVLRPLRRAMVAEVPRSEAHPHFSLEQIRHRFKVPHLQIRIDMGKLRYLQRALASTSVSLAALLQGPAGTSWRWDLCLSLRTLQLVLHPKLRELPVLVGEAGLASWLSFVVQFPGPWKRYIRLLGKVATEQPLRAAQALAAVRGEPADEAAGSDHDGEWLCVECLATFPTRGGMLAHRTRKHGHRIAARFFISGGLCPGCSFDHHSRVRCLRHVQRTPACRGFLETAGLESLSIEEVTALDLADRALRKQAKRAGRSEYAGPPAVFAG
jgi:hypothetical protein